MEELQKKIKEMQEQQKNAPKGKDAPKPGQRWKINDDFGVIIGLKIIPDTDPIRRRADVWSRPAGRLGANFTAG